RSKVSVFQIPLSMILILSQHFFSLPCFHSIAASPYKYPSMLFLHQLVLEFVVVLLILLHAIHRFARDGSRVE
ncbi:hypothetical protein A2U01_0045719, partial [Trifolium medium]|nr:hypothetical protein [Trifolium medium]